MLWSGGSPGHNSGEIGSQTLSEVDIQQLSDGAVSVFGQEGGAVTSTYEDKSVFRCSRLPIQFVESLCHTSFLAWQCALINTLDFSRQLISGLLLDWWNVKCFRHIKRSLFHANNFLWTSFEMRATFSKHLCVLHIFLVLICCLNILAPLNILLVMSQWWIENISTITYVTYPSGKMFFFTSVALLWATDSLYQSDAKAHILQVYFAS